ncbi:MAG: hypothetical protein ACRDJ9_31480, partial [Dehalococcoidia bacterium]
GVGGIAIAAVMWHTITVVAAEDSAPAVDDNSVPPPVLGWSSQRRVWAILASALSIPMLLLLVVLPRLP